MKLWSYLRAGLGTTLNVIPYALTLGRHHRLEGRVVGGVFHNRDHNFRYRFHMDDFERLCGEGFDRFREVCRRQGPGRKFANSFTRRLFRD